MNKRYILTIEWRDRAGHTLAKGWQVPGADFAEAVGEKHMTSAHSTGVDINRGLEG